MSKRVLSVPAQSDLPLVRPGNHEDYPWNPLPWKGMFNKVLFFDPTSGATLELTKILKGGLVPKHYHTSAQTMFLISGSMRTEDGKLTKPGSFNVIPAGQVHGSAVAEEESIQFESFSSVPVYILSDGVTFLCSRDGKFVRARKF